MLIIEKWKYGLEGDSFSGYSLTDMYAECGLLCSAKKGFDLIEYPDVAYPGTLS